MAGEIMIKEKVIVLGSGGHAGIVVDILEEMNKYEIIGIITKDKFHSNKFLGYDVLGDDNVLSKCMKQGIRKVALGIGGFKDNGLRKKIFLKLEKLGFEVVSAIHPNSIIAKTVKIGEGVVIFPGVVINPNVRIGNNVIVATGSTIDHGTVIEDHVLVSAGVTVGANDKIEEGALLALGSKIVSEISIGKNVLIGAGAVVVKDVIKEGIYMGVPARRVK